MWKIVKNQEDEIENDLNAPNLFELYLYFVSHFLNILKETILTLEKHDLTAIELHDIMQPLKDKLENRIKDNFFGPKARSCIKNLKSNEQKNLKMRQLNAIVVV